jgi:hypothetical protein
MLFGTILLLALGKVEPAAGRCPGESALALPVESAAGRLLCPMSSGRCPGSRRLPCPWNRPRAGCPARCPPADALGKVEPAAGRCPGESALALPVEPAAGRLPCPMPSGRLPWESALALPVEPAAGRLLCPMPSGRCPGSRRLPCPWNRPRAGCFAPTLLG